MKPMILLSLNTGLRRGELLNLAFENVNLSLATVTILGENVKSSKTRHVPLNHEALSILKDWFKQSDIKTGLIFKNKNSNSFTDIKKNGLAS